jgi:hypothetical protein
MRNPVNFGKVLGWLLVAIPVAALCDFAVRSNGFLLWTIHHGFRSLARVSLSLGADPNAKKDSQTVLMEAAHWGRTTVVEALLARGAVIDAVDDAHRQALYYAARNGPSGRKRRQSVARARRESGRVGR